jgi:PKD repeat protein
VTKHEWDFDGDGVFDVETGAVASSNHVYAVPGIYHPVVRVTDAEGFFGDSAPGTVYAWSAAFDEVENNDTKETANIMNSFPVVDFAGSIGATGSYDGDNEDWFELQGLGLGQSVHAALTLTSGSENLLTFQLCQGNGAVVQGGVRSGDVIDISYNVKATDLLPFRLKLFLGGDVSSDYSIDVAAFSDTPIASITAPLLSGPTPLTVDFDAGGSSDGDGIVKYEFDLDNDNNWFDNGSSPMLSRTYETNQSRVVRVRVTDSLGFVSSNLAFVHVRAGETFYQESENNDIFLEANALPAFPFSGFGGSIGMAAGYFSLDGDNDDTFSFSASAGQTLNLDFHCNGTYTEALTWLYKADGTFLESVLASEDPGATAPFEYEFTESGDYILWVQNFSPGFGDYSFDATLE